jgi:hypothetical protein
LSDKALTTPSVANLGCMPVMTCIKRRELGSRAESDGAPKSLNQQADAVY